MLFRGPGLEPGVFRYYWKQDNESDADWAKVQEFFSILDNNSGLADLYSRLSQDLWEAVLKHADILCNNQQISDATRETIYWIKSMFDNRLIASRDTLDQIGIDNLTGPNNYLCDTDLDNTIRYWNVSNLMFLPELFAEKCQYSAQCIRDFICVCGKQRER